jgi:hypothetical protein
VALALWGAVSSHAVWAATAAPPQTTVAAAPSSASSSAGASSGVFAPQAVFSLPAALKLSLADPPSVVHRGETALVRLSAYNGATSAVTVLVDPTTLPTGWRVPSTLTIPPGTSIVSLPFTVARGAAGSVSVALHLQAPPGAVLLTPLLTWRWTVGKGWWFWLGVYRAALAGGVLAVVLGVVIAGYLGWVLRVRPRTLVQGALQVTGPDGEALGEVALPSLPRVLLGGAGVAPPAVPIAQVPGSDVLFIVEAHVDGAGGPWVRGLCAWGRPPQTVLRVEAAWPHHIYPGPVPRREMTLYADTAFGAAGVRFTYRTGAPLPPSPDFGGLDLLRGL